MRKCEKHPYFGMENVKYLPKICANPMKIKTLTSIQTINLKSYSNLGWFFNPKVLINNDYLRRRDLVMWRICGNFAVD